VRRGLRRPLSFWSDWSHRDAERLPGQSAKEIGLAIAPLSGGPWRRRVAGSVSGALLVAQRKLVGPWKPVVSRLLCAISSISTLSKI